MTNEELGRRVTEYCVNNSSDLFGFRVINTIDCDDDAQLVVFRYGYGKDRSAAIVYPDDTLILMYDWEEPCPQSVDDIANVKWITDSGRECIIFNGLPRIL